MALDPTKAAAQPASAPAAAEKKITSAAELQAAYPEASAELARNAATAERDRILGIEAIAVAGHEPLVAEMKADGTTSPDQAAARILRVEKQTRAGHSQALRDVETETAGLAHAPAAAAAAAAAPAKPKATNEAGWREEFKASAELQAEFASEDSYVSFQKGVANGSIRILNKARVG